MESATVHKEYRSLSVPFKSLSFIHMHVLSHYFSTVRQQSANLNYVTFGISSRVTEVCLIVGICCVRK